MLRRGSQKAKGRTAKKGEEVIINVRNKEDIDSIMKLAAPLWLRGDSLVVEVITEPTGKWGMARVWRKWMAQTADYMALKGATMPLCWKDGEPYGLRQFNEYDAHELFTAQWLGVDSDGNRLSWSRKGRDGMRPATKSERFHAMQRHEIWSVERGINLFNPRNENEYRQLKEESER